MGSNEANEIFVLVVVFEDKSEESEEV